MKIFFDGGCRGDPPVMEAALVIAGEAIVLPDLGPGTSTDAEWLALIHGATLARSRGLSDIVLIGDSADVVGKANAIVPSRGSAARHHEQFRAVVSSLTRLRVCHVKRSHNLAGIVLARRRAR